MCFIVSKNSKLKIAKHDINVYKAIRKNNRSWLYDMIDNKGKTLLWEPGFEYYEIGELFERNETMWGIRIQGGCFHSSKTEDYLYDGNFMTDVDKVIKMIIPKGAKYYENKNEYVSNRIIYPHE